MHLSILDWKYVRRIDPEVIRKRKKQQQRGIGFWFQNLVIELKRLLAHRGGRDRIIEIYLNDLNLLFNSDPTDISHEIELTLQERMALKIVSLRPCNATWRECRQIYKDKRNRKKKERAAIQRLQDGRRPWTESAARTKPWEAEGISRTTWYKNRKFSADESVPPPSIEEGAGNFSPTISVEPEEPVKMQSILHPYQEEALQNIRLTIKSGVRRMVVQAPTGAGKTKIAAAIVDGGLRKGSKMAFCVPAISLVDQTVESFYAEGIRGIGVIQANHEMTDWSQPVQVCSIQTILARKAYPEANTVIFDECHRLFDAHKAWLEHPDWKNIVPMIGLSATPWSKGLGKYFDSLLKVIDTKSLIEMGYLSKFRVFATGHPDLSGVKNVAGDYHEGQLSEAMQQGSLTADIVRTWQEKWGKDKTLVFGVDKAHAKSIQERFEHAGISCGYQDAETDADERRDIKRKFHNGDYKVVSNIQTLTTGVDWDVRCLVLARPTRSEMLYVQIIGRALRTAPGKEEALILDHSDTTSRLGFVTDIDHDELNDGKPSSQAKKKKTEPLPKECEDCAYLMPPKSRLCPNCGHERKILCKIAENDGELVEIVPGKLTKVGGKKIWTYPEKKVFLAELKGYAIDHGYKPGWAAMKYKDKFGEFPEYFLNQVEPSDVMSPGTLLWIRSRNIAWHNSKHNPQVNA